MSAQGRMTKLPRMLWGGTKASMSVYSGLPGMGMYISSPRTVRRWFMSSPQGLVDSRLHLPVEQAAREKVSSSSRMYRVDSSPNSARGMAMQMA